MPKISEIDWMLLFWDHEKNMEDFNLSADDITHGSKKNCWWFCPKTCKKGCTHRWLASAAQIYTLKTGCPFSGCKNKPKRWCIHETLQYTHPNICEEWVYELNEGLKPEDVTYGSDKFIWWQCKNLCKCGKYHRYKTAIKNRTFGNTGCPYCYKSGERGIPHCFETSLAGLYPKLIKEWHPTKNKKLTPDKLLPGSNIRVCGNAIIQDLTVNVFMNGKPLYVIELVGEDVLIV